MSDNKKEIKVSPLVCTLDIETAALSNNCKIFTIGAVVGDILTGQIKDEFYIRVAPQGQETRDVDDSTMENFWGDYNVVSKEARREVFDTSLPRVKLSEAFAKLNTFIREQGEPVQVFGNGSEFDNAIVLEAYRYYGIFPAWKHWCNQSVRTLVYTGRLLMGVDPKYDIPFEGIPHHALHDARHEFKYIHHIMSSLKGKLVIDPPY